MLRALGNISCDLDLRSNNVFSCKCIFSLTVGRSHIKLCWCIGHMMTWVLVQDQRMCFLVNASP